MVSAEVTIILLRNNRLVIPLLVPLCNSCALTVRVCLVLPFRMRSRRLVLMSSADVDSGLFLDIARIDEWIY